MFTLIAIIGLCGCSTKSSSTTDDAASTKKALVIYYSQTGATKTVAEEIAGKLNSDIVAIEPVTPYDGDYAATIQRWQRELQDSVNVEIKPLPVNLDDYNLIFLGFPIWGGTFALPVKTFIQENSLKDKEVVTFATFGSGGIESATADIAVIQPDAKVIEGYGVRNARVSKASDEINRFLIENGYMKGEIDSLPPYSEATAVTDTETEIFDKACGNYPFPLGKPIKVATRQTKDGVDYRYDVISTAPDGKESTSTIYVTVETDSLPEFTRVIRH